MSVMVLILGALERFGIASSTEVFEIGGKYRGSGVVKQLVGEKAIYKVAEHQGSSNYW